MTWRPGQQGASSIGHFRDVILRTYMKSRKWPIVRPPTTPVRDRIIFKVLLISFKALHGQAPQYISELLHEYRPSRTLRSRSRNLLTVPRSYTVTYGDRSFSVAAAKLWNSIPDHIRRSETLAMFKSSLKTYLFRTQASFK